MQEEVILVDVQDNATGTMEKMEAHRKGLLHRAFSVFLFNDKGQMLLQQRALNKYHSGGLWTNTCCSHPRPGEKTESAASRRLQEEMGIVTSLEKAFSFVYKAELDNALTEHEFDHVYVGVFDGQPQINPNEVHAFKWEDPLNIRNDIAEHPQCYTAWFKICFEEMYAYICRNKNHKHLS